MIGQVVVIRHFLVIILLLASIRSREWLDGDVNNNNLWLVTHYYIPMESDPHWLGHREIAINGFPNETFNEGFIEEMLFQGTGFTKAGKFMTIDWLHSDMENNEWWFIEGVGNQHISGFSTVASVDERLPFGSEILIENYPSRVFRVVDEGTILQQNQIDVFIGIATYEVVNNQYGSFYSRVSLIAR